MKAKIMLSALLMVTLDAAHAGVVIGGTRLIYDASKKEATISVSNPDKIAYLIQSGVVVQEGQTGKAPFIVTPPLFRLDGDKNNVLRVVRAGGNLPEDVESLFWLEIKSIPSAPKQDNTLQIAIKSRMKLIYRPASLSSKTPEKFAEQVKWQRVGDKIQVTNPTPYYMNLLKVSVDGKEVKDATFVAPKSTANFSLPSGTSSGQLSWNIVNDQGGVGPVHKNSL